MFQEVDNVNFLLRLKGNHEKKQITIVESDIYFAPRIGFIDVQFSGNILVIGQSGRVTGNWFRKRENHGNSITSHLIDLK